MNLRHPFVLALAVVAVVIFLTFLASHSSSFAASSPSKCIVEAIRHGKATARLAESPTTDASSSKTMLAMQLVGAISRVDAARATADERTIYRLTGTDPAELHHALVAHLLRLADAGVIGLSRDEAHAVTQA